MPCLSGAFCQHHGGAGSLGAELISHFNIHHRFGAVGKHGSIAVTERIIKTLKAEWLHCVILLKGFDHLRMLCQLFSIWYNEWKPHSTLDGARPDDFYARDIPEMPEREAKIASNLSSLHLQRSVLSPSRHASTAHRKTGSVQRILSRCRQTRIPIPCHHHSQLQLSHWTRYC